MLLARKAAAIAVRPQRRVVRKTRIERSLAERCDFTRSTTVGGLGIRSRTEAKTVSSRCIRRTNIFAIAGTCDLVSLFLRFFNGRLKVADQLLEIVPLSNWIEIAIRRMCLFGTIPTTSVMLRKLGPLEYPFIGSLVECHGSRNCVACAALLNRLVQR